MAEILKIKEFEELNKLNKDEIMSISFISEFWDVHSCAIVKNSLPIGVGLATRAFDAKLKALDCNPVEAIGATIAFSKEIDKTAAQALSKMDFSSVITTEILPDGKKYLEKCKSKIIELDFRLDVYKKYLEENEVDDLTPKGFKVATKLKPTQEQVEDMVFAWKILKTIKKEGIVIAKDFKTRAIELGTTLETIEKAMDNACDGSKEAVMAISKNINDKKQLHPAIQGRITAIIEPKSLENKDADIIKMADKYGITLITVGAEE